MLSSEKGNSKDIDEKMEFPNWWREVGGRGREGWVANDHGILRVLGGGILHFGISRGKEGLKCGRCPWLGSRVHSA